MALIRFEPLTRPAAFLDGTETLLDELNGIIRGWASSPMLDGEADPLFTVRRHLRAFRIDAPWLDEPVIEPQPLRAVANLAVDLAEAYLAENPSLLCLHCAAAVFGGRLVIFPSRARAGKSTLAARLAAAGIAVLTDDLLVLTRDDANGMSLGITVRLRLPLPASASQPFRRFVAGHKGPSDARYLYLDLPEAVRPVLGRSAPIGAIVLLDRQADCIAAITPTGRGDGLQEIILQNLQLGVSAADAMARMLRLAESVPCFTLSYSDLDEAYDALAGLFGDWDTLAAPRSKAEQPAEASGARPIIRSDTGERFQALPHVAVHSIDGSRFLVCARTDCIYRLNDISFGLWNLVKQPTSAAEAAAILHGAFPDVALPVIERDVDALFADLRERDLIRLV